MDVSLPYILEQDVSPNDILDQDVSPYNILDLDVSLQDVKPSDIFAQDVSPPAFFGPLGDISDNERFLAIICFVILAIINDIWRYSYYDISLYFAILSDYKRFLAILSAY